MPGTGMGTAQTPIQLSVFPRGPHRHGTLSLPRYLLWFLIIFIHFWILLTSCLRWKTRQDGVSPAWGSERGPRMQLRSSVGAQMEGARKGTDREPQIFCLGEHRWPGL